ncbi:hypothetical protein LMCDFJHI_01239 [Aeromonas salmonicida]
MPTVLLQPSQYLLTKRLRLGVVPQRIPEPSDGLSLIGPPCDGSLGQPVEVGKADAAKARKHVARLSHQPFAVTLLQLTVRGGDPLCRLLSFRDVGRVARPYHLTQPEQGVDLLIPGHHFLRR